MRCIFAGNTLCFRSFKIKIFNSFLLIFAGLTYLAHLLKGCDQECDTTLAVKW